MLMQASHPAVLSQYPGASLSPLLTMRMCLAPFGPLLRLSFSLNSVFNPPSNPKKARLLIKTTDAGADDLTYLKFPFLHLIDLAFKNSYEDLKNLC